MFFSILQWNVSAIDPGFPSPYGDMFFSIGEKWSACGAGKVSVPLRGYVFLNPNSYNVSLAPELFPSPYGDMFFSIEKTEPNGNELIRFPSPYGDMFFSIPVPANHWEQRAPAAVCGADRRWVLP